MHKASDVTEYRLVKSGMLKAEEAEAIDNYRLLNMWGEINPTDSRYLYLKIFLKIIADYYPGEKLKGFKELSAMHYDKAFVVLDYRIDRLLQVPYISPADLTYMATAEELKQLYSVHDVNNFEDHLFQAGAIKTFEKLIKDNNRPKIKPIETLQLMLAILTNNKPEVEKYLITGVKLDSNTSSLLLRRVKNDRDMIELKQFIPILDLTANTTLGETILHLAAQYGHLELVRELINLGANVNPSTDRDTDSPPLYQAIQNKHSEVAKLLIERGADVNATSVLHLAARNGDVDVVKALIKRGAAVDSKGQSISDDTPLHLAAEKGHLNVVKVLISVHDIKVNKEKNSG